MGSAAGHAPVPGRADETICWSHSWTRMGAAIPLFFVDLSCHQQWDVPIDAMGARRPSDSEAGGCPGVASGGPSFCPWIGQKLIRQIPAGFQISAYLSLTQIRRLNQGRRQTLASEAAQAPRGRAIPKGSSIRMQDPAPRTLHPVHQESRARVAPGPDARPGWDDCGTVVGPGPRALGRTPLRAGRRPAAMECRRHLHCERRSHQGTGASAVPGVATGWFGPRLWTSTGSYLRPMAWLRRPTDVLDAS